MAAPSFDEQILALSKPQAAAKACAGPGGLARIPGHVSFVANQTGAAPCEGSPDQHGTLLEKIIFSPDWKQHELLIGCGIESRP